MTDADTPTARPFASALQYLNWTDRNCCTCAKHAPDDAALDEMPCEIEAALSLACLDGGKVPLPIVRRMAGARCGEHVPAPSVPPEQNV